MPPIDSSPSEVATNALQAIPFSSLIGAPLEACIQAQAQAANSTLTFIEDAGMVNTGTDDDPDWQAAEVIFSYKVADETYTLTVPLLTIVPIPYISINQINIDFTANISASSSTVYEKTKDTSADLGTDVGFQAGWGPYSAKADVKANYSAKKSSRASQESKYSVEYTMNVNVSAGQSSMPAGLQSILSILQGSITNTPADDETDNSDPLQVVSSNLGQ